MSIESGSVLIIDVNGNLMAVTPGSAIPGSTTAFLSAGSDGTNARTILVDTSGRTLMVGAGVAGSPAGGVVSIQGVASGTPIPISGTVTASNASTGLTGSAVPTSATLIGASDGTNLIGLRVKAASTAAAAADPSLVVALSPNSPLPTGANVIGAVTQSGTWSVTATQTTAANLNTLSAQGAAGTAAAGWFVKLTDGTNTAPTMDVAARAGFQKVTDGTNVVTIKPASTAAVATDTALVTIISPNQAPIPVTVSAGTDRTSTGSITSTQNVSISTQASGTCGILVTGTWTGTLVFEASVDGTTFTTLDAIVPSTGVEVTSTTANGTWSAAVAGFSTFRVRGNTVATGSATVFLDAASGTTVVTLGDPLPTGANTIGAVNQGTAAALSGYWPVRITDGTNTMPTMDTVTRKGFQAITDGTNGPVGVKASTTAAAAADPSLVVALSPNSPIPTGANVIGGVTQSGTWSVTATQAVAANLNATVVQPTAANLNATVTGSGSAGTPAAGVVTVQGATGMTAISTVEKRSSTSAVTSIAGSATSVNLLASNANRVAAIIHNDSSAVCFVKLGATASATSFTYRLTAQSNLVIDGQWTGTIDAIWNTATGAARITELT